jgi:hypothetical protein
MVGGGWGVVLNYLQAAFFFGYFLSTFPLQQESPARNRHGNTIATSKSQCSGLTSLWESLKSLQLSLSGLCLWSLEEGVVLFLLFPLEKEMWS